ncbi:MAG: SH3 domain-containing protein [Pseudomonadota bacterium]
MELRRILEAAAKAADVDKIHITSGRQPGTHGKSIGSTRHNGGRAADLQIVVKGKTQTFTDSKPSKAIEKFIVAAASNGATGIGAGVTYMGNRTVHIGFGRTSSDTTKLVWGEKGKSANAPPWLVKAAKKGWSSPAEFSDTIEKADATQGLNTVIARSGLNLRKGPDLSFGITSVLAPGTVVSVVAFEGADDAWARVDLEGDGFVDGFLFASFLEPVISSLESIEDADEPE